MGSPDEVQRERLEELRRRMAAIPARGAGASARVPLGDASGGAHGAPLPVPSPLAALLPEGGLVKGAVVEYSGAGSLLTGLLAAVTAAGGHAAAVALPRLGLLAAAEMGAHLGRLAVVPDPGPDPLEIASVLLDGLDLVVLGLGGRAVPPSRAKVLAARARSKGAVLVVTGGAWSGSVLRIDARVAGYDGLGRGRGRLRTVRLDVCVRGRSAPPRTGQLALTPREGRVEWVAGQSDSVYATATEAVG
ncbi:hypothetical protein ABIA39_003789 [Nocardia sp. GAS34]|uniref:hypothetical protein n=1 Tax=unclassified Nocardia TaxID=2637762 RepID=UPI003D19FD3B